MGSRHLRNSLLLLALATPAFADCPAPVKAAAKPHGALVSCKAEGKNFELEVTRANGDTIELDVSPDGKLLQIEEKIALDKVPAAVTKAFAAKYNAKVTRAEKQTPSAGPVAYELAFEVGGKRREATFTEAGAFVGEE